MKAQIQSAPTPYGSDTKTRLTEKSPDLKDYDLCGIEIERAENGLTVKLRYEIKPDVKAKMRKKEQYLDTYMSPKEYVFEDHASAVKFMVAEITKLSPEEADSDEDED